LVKIILEPSATRNGETLKSQ